MSVPVSPQPLNDYLETGIRQVDGWCLPQLWYALWPLAKLIGPGPMAEIGVFEGKFFIGLCKTFGTSPDNQAVAIDVFDMQEFNLDGAGKGKLDVFRDNLDRQGVGRDNVECITADSLALRGPDSDDLLKRYGAFSFFSIDGCHEVEHTLNDMRFAMTVTAHHGLIAVDDFTNPNWPGVEEAVARLYLFERPVFVPLLVTCNKLLLCSLSHHARYLNAIDAHFKEHYPETPRKKVRRYGYDTWTIQPDFKSWKGLF